jgi:hypothetical protein
MHKELDRQMSGDVSDESYTPLSHNLGANTIITGSIFRDSENTYRIYVNAIDLEKGTFYGTYSASILNDSQMQTLTSNRSDSHKAYLSASSMREWYLELGGGYSWLKDADGTIESITFKPAVKYFFTEKVGFGIYGTLSFPQKITDQGTSLSLYENTYDALGFDFLFGPAIILYESESFYLPFSIGISYSFLRMASHLQDTNEKNSYGQVIGLGTNITAEYHFLPHIYGYLRFQLDFGIYNWITVEEKNINGITVSNDTTRLSDWGLSLKFAPSIGFGFKW